MTPAELIALFHQVGSVNNADYVLLHTAAGNTTKKITAELFRAYLNAGFAISVDENGYLVIGGETTETKLVGMTLRVGETGLEASNDGGTTWNELISYTDILEGGVVYCTEQEYAEWLANDELDENKLYYTYEE